MEHLLVEVTCWVLHIMSEIEMEEVQVTLSGNRGTYLLVLDHRLNEVMRNHFVRFHVVLLLLAQVFLLKTRLGAVLHGR